MIQPESGGLQSPYVLSKQRGQVIFCNQEKPILFIRGEDGIVYASTDRLFLQEFLDCCSSTPAIVTFIPVVGMGTRSATCLEISRQYIASPPSIVPESCIERAVSSNNPHKNTENLFRGNESVSKALQRTHFPPQPPNTPPPSLYLDDHVISDVFNNSSQTSYTEREAVCTISDFKNHQKHVMNRQDEFNFKPSTVIRQNPSNFENPRMTKKQNEYNQVCRSAVHPRNTSNSPKDELALLEMKHPTLLTESELHILLNCWYHIPEKYNKESYPFPCEGFVVLSNNSNDLLIFTRRLGCITRKEDPTRNGRPYAYFMVCGPNNYRAWEYDERQPPPFKSTKFVNDGTVEMKGYALMAPGRRDDSESQWWAWNDQIGFMRCQSNCARILKKKYSTWQPTCQMVMFDATSIDNGRNWLIKTISYIDFPTAHQHSYWPIQAYFIDNLVVLPINQQPNPSEEVVFFSKTINERVYAKCMHILELPKRAGPNAPKYSGVIFATWGRDGLGRRYRALIAAPESYWAAPRMNLVEVARVLEVTHWNKAPNQSSFNMNFLEQLPDYMNDLKRDHSNVLIRDGMIMKNSHNYGYNMQW